MSRPEWPSTTAVMMGSLRCEFPLERHEKTKGKSQYDTVLHTEFTSILPLLVMYGLGLRGCLWQNRTGPEYCDYRLAPLKARYERNTKTQGRLVLLLQLGTMFLTSIFSGEQYTIYTMRICHTNPSKLPDSGSTFLPRRRYRHFAGRPWAGKFTGHLLLLVMSRPFSLRDCVCGQRKWIVVVTTIAGS